MENYKVCILAGGVASQMGDLTKNVHSSILPINFKATISYILEKFPKGVEFVLALGHKKETVMDYLRLAHPERKFTFVQSDTYTGPGSGPGFALLECKKHLQCPFVFVTSDTIVLEEIPRPSENWFGIAPVKETEKYCTVKMKNNLIYQMDDKMKTDNKYAFIGLAGVKDYETFWNALEHNKEVIKGRIQVSNGFKKLIEKKLVPVGFTWFDTGDLNGYKEANRNFAGGDKGFDFGKTGEFLYFVNGRVIKFFADEEITSKRVARAKYLKGLVPEIEMIRGNFYSYKKIDGQVLYGILNRQLVRDFLQWSKNNLWKEQSLNSASKEDFRKSCEKFYKDKTLQRMDLFYKRTGIDDGWDNINGIQVPPLKEMLDKVDWNSLFEGTPSLFHGDLQFDNILVKTDPKSNLKKFMLLDWRHEFGNRIEYGDMYYDLAKLYGGVSMHYPLIKEGNFNFDMSGTSVYFNFQLSYDLVEAKEEYESFITRNNLDINKIKLLTSLIFLNMSPLHNSPFDKMLYFLGKSKLYYVLKEAGVYN